MEASIFSGVVNGAKRVRVPSRPMRNLVKFHDPSAEHAGQRLFQITKQRVCGGPLTSTFSNIGKLTP